MKPGPAENLLSAPFTLYKWATTSRTSGVPKVTKSGLGALRMAVPAPSGRGGCRAVSSIARRAAWLATPAPAGESIRRPGICNRRNSHGRPLGQGSNRTWRTSPRATQALAQEGERGSRKGRMHGVRPSHLAIVLIAYFCSLKVAESIVWPLSRETRIFQQVPAAWSLKLALLMYWSAAES
jgi:hypothetical protein